MANKNKRKRRRKTSRTIPHQPLGKRTNFPAIHSAAEPLTHSDSVISPKAQITNEEKISANISYSPQSKSYRKKSSKSFTPTFLSKMAVATISIYGASQLVSFFAGLPSLFKSVGTLSLIMAIVSVSLLGARLALMKSAGISGKSIFYIGCFVAIILPSMAYIERLAQTAQVTERSNIQMASNSIVLADKTITDHNFLGADLTGAHFNGSTFTKVDFTSSDLSNASFVDTTLSDVNFAGANLCGTDFRGVDMRSVLNFDQVKDWRFMIIDKETQFPEGLNALSEGIIIQDSNRPILTSCKPGQNRKVEFENN